MNRWKIGIVVAGLTGVASFRVLPLDWVLPAFGIGIAAALVFAIGARIDTKPRSPVNPAVEAALFAVNLPSDPLAKIPNGWALRSFVIAIAYVLCLGLSIVLGAAYAQLFNREWIAYGSHSSQTLGSMNKMVILGLRVLAFMLFAWLTQHLFSFNEIDMCFDLGGAVENDVCVGGRHGQWALVAQGSYISWLVSLAIPALVCVGVYTFILAAGRRFSAK